MPRPWNVLRRHLEGRANPALPYMELKNETALPLFPQSDEASCWIPR